MKCWNCLKDISSKAKVCPFCEAAVEDDPTPEEIEAVQDSWIRCPAKSSANSKP